ncbi:glycosyltransferase [Ruegeria arenilitoris]|uniref:glycosyltransferase n=1 Tax=Ruegeria arenilitoris TaxID=1173585 RepID=UPI001C2C0CD5|nr:glycosyltransferase [Ruegeria arenilitoris]
MSGRRVVHAIDHLEIGGAQRLLDVMLNEDLSADTLTVLSFGSTSDFLYDRLVSKGAEVVVVENCRLLTPVSYLRVLRALRKLRPDALHLHLTYATIIGAVVGRWANIPMVASIHNVRTVQYDGVRGRVLRLMETLAVRMFVDRVVFVGQTAAQANEGRFPGKPMTTIDNVVEPAKPSSAEARETLRSELGADPGEVIAISTGRLAPVKDISTMLKAFAITLKYVPRARLWICGEGQLREELEEQAERLQIGDRVQFLGGRKDVNSLLNSADIFVLSSVAEGLPLSLLEAMAAGLPVVSTTVGSVPEYVSASQGRLVPPGQPEALAEALAELCSDPELRSSMSANATVSAKRFTDIAAWKEKLKAQYDALPR